MALQEYRRVLRVFRDPVVEGKFPDEDYLRIPKQPALLPIPAERHFATRRANLQMQAIGEGRIIRTRNSGATKMKQVKDAPLRNYHAATRGTETRNR